MLSGRLLLWLLLLLLAGCGGSERLVAPTFSPHEGARIALQEWDTNQDGKLDAKELESAPSLRGSLEGMDRDHDGCLDESEIEARLKFILQANAGYTNVPCQVTRGGQPLEGVVVTLIPEKMMGPTYRPATGKSNKSGYVELVTEGVALPGVLSGFFRVEASLKGGDGMETLPERFNSRTKLGWEIGPSLRGILRIELGD